MFRIINDTPITYMDWLTYVANSESVISHIDSVLKDIQQASEEEAMDNEMNMVIPILMHLSSLIPNWSVASRTSSNKGDVIDDVKLFPTVYHRI